MLTGSWTIKRKALEADCIDVFADSRHWFELSDRRAVAAEIRHASHLVGFFYMTNYGIPADAIAHLAEVRTDRQQVPEQKPDLKEGYYIGMDRGADDPLMQAGILNHGANQWPDVPS